MVKGEIYPANSDIDITVVIKDALPGKRSHEAGHIVAISRFFKKIFFVFGEMHVFTEREAERYIVQGYGTEEYGEGIRPWRLVGGTSRVDFRLLEQNDPLQPFVLLRPFSLYSDIILRDYFCRRDGERYFYRDIYKSFLSLYKYSLFLKGQAPSTFQRYGETLSLLRELRGNDKNICGVLNNLADLEKKGFTGRFDSGFVEEIITLFLLECSSLFPLFNGRYGKATVLGDSDAPLPPGDCDSTALLKNAHDRGSALLAVVGPVAKEKRFKSHLRDIRGSYRNGISHPLALHQYPLVFDVDSVKIFMCLNPHIYLSLICDSRVYLPTDLRKILMEVERLVRQSIPSKIPHWFCRSFIAFRDGDLGSFKRNIGVIMRAALFIKHGIYAKDDEELLRHLDERLPAFSGYYRSVAPLNDSANGSTSEKKMREVMEAYYRMLPLLEQELYDSRYGIQGGAGQ